MIKYRLNFNYVEKINSRMRHAELSNAYFTEVDYRAIHGFKKAMIPIFGAKGKGIDFKINSTQLKNPAKDTLYGDLSRV